MIKINEEGLEYLNSLKFSKTELLVTHKILELGSGVDVAKSLFVTIKSVKFHKTNIYKKLGIKKDTQLFIRLFNFLYMSDAPQHLRVRSIFKKDQLPFGIEKAIK